LSIDGWALDPFNDVYRQDFLLPVQFETEFAQDCEDGRQAGEVHVSVAIRWRRWQSHGKPTFGVCGEQPVKVGAIDDWQICPVRDVTGEVVHTDGGCLQRMAEADDKSMAAFRGGIEDAIFCGDGRSMEVCPAAGYGKSIG